MKNKLKAVRKSKKMTQVEVATIVGIQETSYQRYERGTTLPVIDIALKIARALDCTVEDIFTLDDEEQA